MKEGIIKDTTELVLKEIQSILSLSYIMIVGIGMLFNYQKYDQFGINIFDYADILEFLIAPFSEPTIFLFSIVSILLGVMIFSLDDLWKKKHPNSYSKINFGLDKKRWFNVYRYSIYGSLIIFYLYLSADLFGQHSYSLIKKSKPIKITFADQSTTRGKLIGNTKDILFILRDTKVSAIPISSLVKEFELSEIE